MPSPWGNSKYSAFSQKNNPRATNNINPKDAIGQGLLSGAMAAPLAELIIGNKVVETTVGKKVKVALRAAEFTKSMMANEVAEQVTGDQDDSLTDFLGDGLVVGGSMLAVSLTPVGWGALAAWGIGTAVGIGGSFIKDIIAEELNEDPQDASPSVNSGTPYGTGRENDAQPNSGGGAFDQGGGDTTPIGSPSEGPSPNGSGTKPETEMDPEQKGDWRRPTDRYKDSGTGQCGEGKENYYEQTTYEQEYDNEGNPTGRWRKRTKIGTLCSADDGRPEQRGEYVSKPFEDTDTDGDGIPDSEDDYPDDSSEWGIEEGDHPLDNKDSMENPIDDKPNNQKSHFEDIITGSNPNTNWGPDGKPGGGYSTFDESIFNADSDINWGPDGDQTTVNSNFVDILTNVDPATNWGPDGEPGGNNGEYTIFNPAIEGLGGINPFSASTDGGMSLMQKNTDNLLGNASDSIQLLATTDLF